MLLESAAALLFCLVVVCAVRLYVASVKTCKSADRMVGKTIIITGGTSGIGRATAIDLAKRGGRVYIASEIPVEQGQAVSEEIRKLSGNKLVFFRPLDLGSMKSVRNFANDILREKPEIHVLINNAGVYLYQERITEDGLEATFAINYLGHFLLTLLLLDRLRQSGYPRILFLTSFVHAFGYLDFDDMLMQKGGYNHNVAYNRSKLAQLMFARELGRRLHGTGATVCSVSPGVVDTAMVGQTLPLIAKVVLCAVKKLIFVSPEKGAQTCIHCAVAPQVQGVSGYYSNCTRTCPSARATNGRDCAKLWEYSISLINTGDLDLELNEY